MNKSLRLFLVFQLLSFISHGQALLSGSVVDEVNNEPIPGAVVQIEGLEAQAFTDFNGEFIFKDLPVSLVNISVQTHRLCVQN